MLFGFLYKFFYPFTFKDRIESNQQPCTKKQKKEVSLFFLYKFFYPLAFKDGIESNQQPCTKKQKKEGLVFGDDRITQSVVAKWLGFVWSRQVESLDFNFRCESVKHAVVHLLVPNNLPLPEETENSILTSDVHISGATLVLEDLWILASHFSGSVIINISAPNLSKVSVDARLGQLWFKNVPRLAEACLRISGPRYPMHHFTSTLSCLTSQLHKLILNGPDANKLLGKGFPQLPNLKELLVEHTCLLPVTHVISACPRLQCFFFKVAIYF
ncbi:hypothetical protein SASPL_132298 [Salvia splendens]|uniref:Uncharacterized protein n=1 Tax=Salvia splendens TaxID=180675 RepID=A0A8X8XBU3_SALSN|nr:hypothetical protein SASPL_132298 [Salvia splendens]